MQVFRGESRECREIYLERRQLRKRGHLYAAMLQVRQRESPKGIKELTILRSRLNGEGKVSVAQTLRITTYRGRRLEADSYLEKISEVKSTTILPNSAKTSENYN